MRALSLVSLAPCLVACAGTTGDVDTFTIQPSGPDVSASYSWNNGAATLGVRGDAVTARYSVKVTTADPDPALPKASTVQGKAYRFDVTPAGITFKPAAKLQLPIPSTVGSGMTPVISMLPAGGSAWMDLATTVSGSKALADVTTIGGTLAVRLPSAGGTDGGTIGGGPCPKIVGSCHFGDANCYETDTSMPANAKAMCNAVSGNTWFDAPCPSANKVGGCKYSMDVFGAPGVTCEIHWYYAPMYSSSAFPLTCSFDKSVYVAP